MRGCKSFIDGDGNERKASVSIRRGEEEWPLIGPDRDAAFYALVLCCTADDPGGIMLYKDMDGECGAQQRYREIYCQMSVRDPKDCPDISLSDMRRPIISRVNLAINPGHKKVKNKLLDGTQYLTERELYEVSKSQNKYFVVLNPSNVIVCSKQEKKETERPLKESALYTSVIQINK